MIEWPHRSLPSHHGECFNESRWHRLPLLKISKELPSPRERRGQLERSESGHRQPRRACRPTRPQSTDTRCPEATAETAGAQASVHNHTVSRLTAPTVRSPNVSFCKCSTVKGICGRTIDMAWVRRKAASWNLRNSPIEAACPLQLLLLPPW